MVKIKLIKIKLITKKKNRQYFADSEAEKSADSTDAD